MKTEKTGWGRTPKYSFGIEEEFQLFGIESLRPYPAKKFLDANIHPELLYNQIEIRTSECGSIDQARTELTRLHGIIVDKCKESSVLCIAAGLVPFLKEKDIRVTPSYLDFLSDEVSQKRDYVFNATHVHVSMANPKEATVVMHGGDYFAPELIAISANSPVLLERDTKNLCHRRALWLDIGRRQMKTKRRIGGNDVIRKYKIHEYFVPLGIKYDDYKDMIADFGILGSWLTLADSRLNKGTVQFRHFDQVPDINFVLSLASFVRGLSSCLINNKIEIYPYTTSELQKRIYRSIEDALRDAEIKESCEKILETIVEESGIVSKNELAPLRHTLQYGTFAEEQLRLCKDPKLFCDRFSISD